jgi:hypothetical protein
MPTAWLFEHCDAYSLTLFMQTHPLIADQQLKDADGIHTVDPDNRNAAGYQLWGTESQKSRAQTANDGKVVEIALSSDDHAALLSLIARIETLKGRLPPDVEVLRRNLSSQG